MENSREFKDAFDLGKESVVTREYFGVPVILHPENMRVTKLDELENQSRERPRFLEQTSQFDQLDDFIAYVNRYKTPETTIFYNRDGKFAASIDWHEKSEDGQTINPSYKRHTACYRANQSDEAKEWLAKNNHKFDQKDFSAFIEDRINDFEEPSGERFLEIASTLKATIGANFDQKYQTHNGEYSLSYREEINGSAGADGRLAIPKEFTILVKAFHGGDTYRLSAWLRYRPGRDGVTMWYTIKNPNLMLDLAVEQNVAKIKSEISGVHIYAGASI